MSKKIFYDPTCKHVKLEREQSLYCGEDLNGISEPLIRLSIGEITLQEAYDQISKFVYTEQSTLLRNTLVDHLDKLVKKGVLASEKS